jgi:hypothetical protein
MRPDSIAQAAAAAGNAVCARGSAAPVVPVVADAHLPVEVALLLRPVRHLRAQRQPPCSTAPSKEVGQGGGFDCVEL